MLEQLKKILIDEIIDKINRYEELTNQIKELEKEYNSIKEPEFLIITSPSDPKTNRSIFYKLLKNKKYKEDIKSYEIKKNEYENLKHQQKEQEDKYYEEKPKLAAKITELKQQIEKENLEEIKEKYEKIKNSHNIKELGLDIKKVKKIFEKKNIPLVLTKNDNIVQNESDFKEESDFVLVHKTKYAPKRDEILTLTNSPATYTTIVDTGKEELPIEFKLKRDTIHFGLNGEVTSTVELNIFSSRKYAVIIPLESVQNIINFSTADTYSKGNVKIDNGIILCPENEIEIIQKENQNTIVIGYKDKETVDDYANILISLLGYKYESANEHNWYNDEDVSKVDNNIYQMRNFQSYGAHSGSYNFQEEKIDQAISFLLSLFKKLKEENIEFDIRYLSDELTGIIPYNYELQMPTTMYEFGFYEPGEKYNYLIDSLEKIGIHLPYYVKNIRDVIKESKEKVYSYIEDNEICDYIKECEEKTTDINQISTCILTYSILKQIKLSKEKEKII